MDQLELDSGDRVGEGIGKRSVRREVSDRAVSAVAEERADPAVDKALFVKEGAEHTHGPHVRHRTHLARDAVYVMRSCVVCVHRHNGGLCEHLCAEDVVCVIVGVDDCLDRLVRYLPEFGQHVFGCLARFHGVDDDEPVHAFDHDRVRKPETYGCIDIARDFLDPLSEDIGVRLQIRFGADSIDRLLLLRRSGRAGGAHQKGHRRHGKDANLFHKKPPI